MNAKLTNGISGVFIENLASSAAIVDEAIISGKIHSSTPSLLLILATRGLLSIIVVGIKGV